MTSLSPHLSSRPSFLSGSCSGRNTASSLLWELRLESTRIGIKIPASSQGRKSWGSSLRMKDEGVLSSVPAPWLFLVPRHTSSSMSSTEGWVPCKGEGEGHWVCSPPPPPSLGVSWISLHGNSSTENSHLTQRHCVLIDGKLPIACQIIVHFLILKD